MNVTIHHDPPFAFRNDLDPEMVDGEHVFRRFNPNRMVNLELILHMGVSINGGTQSWMVYSGESH